MKIQQQIRNFFVSVFLASVTLAPLAASAEETFDVKHDDHLRHEMMLVAQGMMTIEAQDLIKFFTEERPKMTDRQAEDWQYLFKEVFEGPKPDSLAFGAAGSVNDLLRQYLSVITIPGEGAISVGVEELAQGVRAAIAYQGRVTGAERTHPKDARQWNLRKVESVANVFAETADFLQRARSGTQPNYRTAFPNAQVAFEEALRRHGDGAKTIEQVPNHLY